MAEQQKNSFADLFVGEDRDAVLKGNLKPQDFGLTDHDVEAMHKGGLNYYDVQKQSSLSSKSLDQEKGPLNLLSEVGRGYDSYYGAPVRSGAGALLEGKGVKGAVNAYREQFGADPRLAPTGKELAVKAGVPNTPMSSVAPGMFSPPGKGGVNITLPGMQKGFNVPTPEVGGALDISPAGAAGVGAEMLLDTSTLLPVAQMAKGAYGLARGTAKYGVAPIARMAAPGATAAAEEGARAVESFVKNIGKNFSPKYAEDFPQALEIAKKYGISPEALSDSIKYGDQSPITRISKSMAQGPQAEELVAKHQAGLDEIRGATDNFIQNYIGKGQAPLDPQGAGELIKQSWDNAVDRFFKSRDVTYSNVLDNASATQLTQDAKHNLLENLGEMASELESRHAPGRDPALRAQSNLVQERLNHIADIAENGTYQDLVDAMRIVGEDGYKYRQLSLTSVPQDVKMNRRIYESIQDAIFDTVEVVEGKDVAAALKRSNEEFSQFFKDNSVIESALLDDSKGGEKVFNSLINSGDSRKIEALTNILKDDPKAMAQIKASWLENIKRLDKDDKFSFARFGSELRNGKKSKIIQKNLFTPDELQGLDELTRLGEAYGPAIINFSGTEDLRGLRDIGESIKTDAKQNALYGYLKKKAEKSPPPAAGQAMAVGSRFSPGQLSETDKGILNSLKNYGRENLNTGRLRDLGVKQSAREYSLERDQDRLREFRRRLNKQRGK